MSGAKVNGAGLVSIELTMPRIGAWHADIEVDTETVLYGKATITIDDVVFVGTVIPGRSGVFASMATARIVGGAGGLTKVLDAKQYAGGSVNVGAVIKDILRAAGETLAPTADLSILGHGLASWERSKGQASHALTNVCDAAQASWRVLNDGTIWVGLETWPAVTFSHVVEDEDWGKGVIQIASDAPLLEPGTVLDGQRIELVRHTVCDASLRSFGYLTSPALSLSRFLRGIRRQIDYSRMYPCKVTAQNADGTLQLLPDDAVVKGSGLDKVKPRHGMPGFTVTVAVGARVMLGFDAGDPTRPYAAMWDEGGGDSVHTITFNGGQQSVSRVGDLVQSGGTGTVVTLVTMLPIPAPAYVVAPGTPIQALISFSSVVPTALSATPLYGSVITGAPKLKS